MSVTLLAPIALGFIISKHTDFKSNTSRNSSTVMQTFDFNLTQSVIFCCLHSTDSSHELFTAQELWVTRLLGTVGLIIKIGVYMGAYAIALWNFYAKGFFMREKRFILTLAAVRGSVK